MNKIEINSLLHEQSHKCVIFTKREANCRRKIKEMQDSEEETCQIRGLKTNCTVVFCTNIIVILRGFITE